jgi:cytochrome c peroxidase
MLRCRCAVFAGLPAIVAGGLAALGLVEIGCQSGEPMPLLVTPVSDADAFRPDRPPLGLPELTVPDDNPMTPEKVELGKMLYFDGRLSRNGKVACATCHDPQAAWAEHGPTSKGIDNQVGPRNAPTIINAAYATAQFWDGRAASLEEQALGPIQNPIEMGHSLPALVQVISKVPEYRERFKTVFGSEVTTEGVTKALAAFERTVLGGNSAYDRFRAGNSKALSAAQKRGLELFENCGCSTCHAPPLFSTYEYYNAGVGMNKDQPDEGRKNVTRRMGDLGRFRVPSLREVARTAPYFHDGSAATLDEAVALMAAGGEDNRYLSPALKSVRASKLGEQDRKDLVEFLHGLSGDFPMIGPPMLP